MNSKRRLKCYSKRYARSKLDALLHFHFAPKPVIEDMSIQANVPALAMEEIAPIAVLDATMLALEEIFQGKGDIKEERDLSRSDRKRRRANKKQRFKSATDDVELHENYDDTMVIEIDDDTLKAYPTVAYTHNSSSNDGCCSLLRKI